VDASEATFSRIARGIRDLALEIPVALDELTLIAELGGQLGIPAEGLENFTEVIAKLAATTNLDIEEASTAIARFANVMGTSRSDFDNLGATIVDLGNNFATTEAEILTFGQRLSGIGSTVGLTESDVLGLATAFTSLGEPAERGATAVQRTFVAMLQAISDGGERLQLFAATAGITADEFARLFAEDPAQAFIAFERGIGELVDTGGNATRVLKDLGLGSQRTTTLLLKGATNWEILAEAVSLASDAWFANIALNEEADKRFQTTASQITLMGNAFRDLSIELGTLSTGFVNFTVRAFREFFILTRESTVAMKVFGAALGILLTQRILSKMANAFVNLGEAMGRSVGRTGMMRFFANSVNRLGGFAAVANPAIALLAVGLAAVGGVMAANRANLRRYNENLETLAETMDAFRRGTATAAEVFEAFNNILTQKRGLFDRTIDLSDFRAFSLDQFGMSIRDLALEALNDVDKFDRRVNSLVDSLTKRQKELREILPSGFVDVAPGTRVTRGASLTAQERAVVDELTKITTDLATLGRLRAEIGPAVGFLRDQQRLAMREFAAENVGLIGEFSGAPGPGESLEDAARRMAGVTSPLYKLTKEEYGDFLDDMMEDTRDFAFDFTDGWNSIIEDFTDRFFDWSAAWNEYETVTALSTTKLANSVEKWVNDQERLFNASLFVYEQYGDETGAFFDQLPEDLQRRLAAALAKDPNLFATQFGIILSANADLLGLEFAKFLSKAPEGAQKGLDAWLNYFDTVINPALLAEGPQSADSYMQGVISQFTEWKVALLQEAPLVAEAFDALLIEALSSVDTDLPLMDIAALSANMTTEDKLRFFTSVGIEWKLAIALAFADLPLLMGDTAESAAQQVADKFAGIVGIKSPSKLFIKYGKQVAEGFRMGVGGMGKIMEMSAIDVAQNFNPAVPQTAGIGATTITNEINIHNPVSNSPFEDTRNGLAVTALLGSL
jgi:TP901 family phage tail tape measure protein